MEGHLHARRLFAHLTQAEGNSASPSLALCSKTDFFSKNNSHSSVRLIPERQASGSLKPPGAWEVGASGRPGTEMVHSCPRLHSLGEGLNHRGSSGAKSPPSGQGGLGGLDFLRSPGWGAAPSRFWAPACAGPGLRATGVTESSPPQPASALGAGAAEC